MTVKINTAGIDITHPSKVGKNLYMAQDTHGKIFFATADTEKKAGKIFDTFTGYLYDITLIGEVTEK